MARGTGLASEGGLAALGAAKEAVLGFEDGVCHVHVHRDLFLVVLVLVLVLVLVIIVAVWLIRLVVVIVDPASVRIVVVVVVVVVVVIVVVGGRERGPGSRRHRVGAMKHRLRLGGSPLPSCGRHLCALLVRPIA